MIRVNGLVKEFGPIRAWDGLDLHVPEGAVYGLVGPNGAGKTTALQHIAGVYHPTSGEVLVHETGRNTLAVSADLDHNGTFETVLTSAFVPDLGPESFDREKQEKSVKIYW